MAYSIFLVLISAALLLSTPTHGQPTLPSHEQEAVYRVLESINPAVSWRLLFPDDLCSSAPHGILCQLFDDDSVHITQLSFGYVSDYSSNPLCTPNSTIHPHLLTPLTHLRKLFFYKCFTGPPVPFPDFSPLNNVSIEHLVFIDNPSLFGPITGKISNMNLRRFILTGSNVSGEIKDALNGLDNAEEITLSRNQFSGELPETMGGMKKLKILDLSLNRLEGNLTESIGGFTSLLKLDLSYNRFSGGIPESLKSLKELEFLDLSHNSFTNSGIPAFLSGMARLKEVYLSGNSLGGQIPPEIWGNLKGIIGIGLSGTGLVGSIPPAMGLALKNVCYIGLDNNGLEGPIPEEFGALENLHEINLENNRLSGSLPFEDRFVAKMGKKLRLAGNPGLCVEKRAINGSLVDLKLCRHNLSSPFVSSLLSSSASAPLQQWRSSCFLLFFAYFCYLHVIS